MSQRIIISLTGATGQLYGIRGLELLAGTGYEVHLILSEAAKINIKQEIDLTLSDIEALATETHDNSNIGAKPASGSFRTEGMLIAPCSMKTLSMIAHGQSENLISRSADVMLKERRPLVVMPREKPFNQIHLKNMLKVTDAGGIVVPPFLSFYQGSKSIDELVTRTMARTVSYLGVDIAYEEWKGLSPSE